MSKKTRGRVPLVLSGPSEPSDNIRFDEVHYWRTEGQIEQKGNDRNWKRKIRSLYDHGYQLGSSWGGYIVRVHTIVIKLLTYFIRDI